MTSALTGRRKALMSFVATLALAACSPGSQNQASTPSSPSDGSTNPGRQRVVAPLEQSDELASWDLPLSRRWPKIHAEANLIAEDVYVARCRGLKPTKAAASSVYLARLEHGDTWNNDLRRIFTEVVAERYGYRVSTTFATQLENPFTPPSPAPPDWRKCFDKLRQDIQLPPYSGTFQDVQAAAFSTARRGPKVSHAVQNWRRCFSAATGTPPGADPFEMPTKAMVEKYRIPRSLAGMPSSDESRLAVADARCQASSGFARELYSAEFDAQIDLIAKNTTKIETEVKEFQRYDETMRRIVMGD